MSVVNKITRKINRNLGRIIKHTRQRFNPLKVVPRALFVCGSQRSGTNMLISVLDKSSHTRIYNEDHPLAFQNFRLRHASHISKIVARSPCSWIVFKCIMDSQHIKTLLEDFPLSKCIWIYRDYEDVAQSAESKWMNAQRHIIRNIAIQNNRWDRWYTEAMSVERRDLVRKYFHDEMNEITAGALKWYLRNILYFDNQLSLLPKQVLLVNYNCLVADPEAQFEKIGDFLEMPITRSSYLHVHAKSVQKSSTVPIEESVKNLCDQLINELKLADQKST